MRFGPCRGSTVASGRPPPFRGAAVVPARDRARDACCRPLPPYPSTVGSASGWSGPSRCVRPRAFARAPAPVRLRPVVAAGSSSRLFWPSRRSSDVGRRPFLRCVRRLPSSQFSATTWRPSSFSFPVESWPRLSGGPFYGRLIRCAWLRRRSGWRLWQPPRPCVGKPCVSDLTSSPFSWP